MSQQYISSIARKKKSTELSESDILLILEKYPKIGPDVDEWIKWVLDSRKRNVCPYR